MGKTIQSKEAFSTNEMKAIVLAVSMSVEQLNSITARASLNEKGKSTAKEMIDSMKSAYVKLKADTGLEDVSNEEITSEDVAMYAAEPGETTEQRLKRICQEIAQIIKREDMAAIVLLHSPGHGEYLNLISPSYSSLSQDRTEHEPGGIRMKVKPEDFGGDKKAMLQKIISTAEMINTFLSMATPTFNALFDIMNELERMFETNPTEDGQAES